MCFFLFLFPIGLSEIVKVLLEHDANVELQDNDGKTALHRAAEVQSISICERILAISPYLKSVRDAKDKVPADYATDDSLAALLKH